MLNPNRRILCTYCSNNDVETEWHILITCTEYSNLGSDLFNVAKDLIINFDVLDSECKFITIIESGETSLVEQLAKCIYHISKRIIGHVNAGHVNLDDNLQQHLESRVTIYLYWYGWSIKALLL